MLLLVTVLVLATVHSAQAQIVATHPSSPETLRAASDFPSQAFQDRWDMNERTDLGSFTYSADNPASNLGNIGVSGGIFSAVTTSADPNFWLLDTGNPYAANLGKTGKLFPIDSTKYKRLLMRMRLSGGSMAASNPTLSQTMQILWSNNTIYSTINTSNAVFTWPGWWIYSVDLEALGTAAGVPWASSPVDSLRVDPVAMSGVSVTLDWARLVSSDPALFRDIRWTGSGAVDIFLDDDNNPANGMLGQIARGATGNSYSFYVGGLPQGTYYVALSPAGSTSSYSYAPAYWQVEDNPVLRFISPSPEGSSDDFATVQLNNAWDMDTIGDIDKFQYVSGQQITTIPAVDEAGASLGNVRVLRGLSPSSPTPGFGDPIVYPFWFQTRGYSKSIDTSRYRILTFEMGLAGNRDINNGSIARVVWKNKGESVENVSDDIILNHRPDANTIQKISLDMKTLALDPADSPSRTGWNGQVDNFRLDPHEFSDARAFWIKSIKLTSLETANGSYTIRWSYAAQGASSVSMSLYWDTDASGYNGTLIASGLNPASGAFAWDVSALPAGKYYIYSIFTINGAAVNRHYAQWPILVDRTFVALPTIALGRTSLSFGATQNGAIVTQPQEVTITVKGAGTVTWTATTDRPWLVVSPASGTGTGKFSVSVQGNAFPSPSFMDGTVTVTATGAANSPQYVRMTLNTINPASTAPPFGIFDTPADNATGVAGSLAITGWALDDTQVSKVQLWRDPIGSEPTHSNGLIYVGDAVFVPNSRPDVEAAYASFPAAYRSGWGYLMLTTGLPPTPGFTKQGNGVYRFHAYAVDLEGKQTKLGSKTISVDNASSKKPFGAIDTPGQGETISGTAFVNFGWALTPQPNNIPVNGSTVSVSIDGVQIGRPVYGLYRPDIAGGFPGYANSGSGVGYLYVDTTRFSNGMHNIGWLVSDSAGNTDGMGSRFFTIFNQTAEAPAQAPVALRRAHARTEEVLIPSEPRHQPEFRTGYSPLTPLQGAEFDESRGAYVIELREMGRIELALPSPGILWHGSHQVLDDRRELPPGSTWDEKASRFVWQLGPGQTGEYTLAWATEEQDAGSSSLVTIIRVLPAETIAH